MLINLIIDFCRSWQQLSLSQPLWLLSLRPREATEEAAAATVAAAAATVVAVGAMVVAAEAMVEAAEATAGAAVVMAAAGGATVAAAATARGAPTRRNPRRYTNFHN